MKNFQQRGETLTLVAPSGGVVSGGFYKIGQHIVVASADKDEADNFEGQLMGVFSSAPKTTGQAWAVGQPLYWVAGTSKFSTTASGNTPAGSVVEVAGSSATTGTVRLDGVARPDAS